MSGKLFKVVMKRILKSLLVLFMFIGIAQYVKESYFNDPKRIFENTRSKYQDLSYLSLKNKIYGPDISITYQLTYMNFIPLGQVHMSVEDREDLIMLKAIAFPAGYLKNMYGVEAEIYSTIDKDRFFPLKYVESVKILERKREKEIIFYPEKNLAEREGKKYKIPPMTFCPLSAFYYLRLQDLGLGKAYKIKLLSKEEIYVLNAKVVEDKDGVVKLVGQARRKDLSSQHGASFELFVSKESRIPLLMKVRTSTGIIAARAT